MLDDEDYIFLEEYRTCVRPFEISSKNLEANRYTFGLYLPSLITLRKRLSDLHMNNMQFCTAMAEAIQTGFEQRSGEIMDIFKTRSVPFYIAMVSNPEYKLNFMGMQCIPNHVLENVRNFLSQCNQSDETDWLSVSVLYSLLRLCASY